MSGEISLIVSEMTLTTCQMLFWHVAWCVKFGSHLTFLLQNMTIPVTNFSSQRPVITG